MDSAVSLRMDTPTKTIAECKHSVCMLHKPLLMFFYEPVWYALLLVGVVEEEVLTGSFLFHVLHRLVLVDARSEIVGITTERNAEQLEESVHAGQQILRCVCRRVHRWCSLEYDDAVGQVGGHDEIVLDDKSGFLCVQDVSGKNGGILPIIYFKDFTKIFSPIFTTFNWLCWIILMKMFNISIRVSNLLIC